MECPLWELKYHTTKYFNYLAHFPTAFWAANDGSIFTLLVVVVSMECPVGIKEFRTFHFWSVSHTLSRKIKRC